MATYKSSELFQMISEIVNEGYQYVNIYEGKDDETEPSEYLNFEAIDEDLAGIEYDSVDSCAFPSESSVNTPEQFSGDDPCAVSFTINEFFTIMNAVDNALEYFKELSKDTKLPRETRDQIKASSVSCRNLQAKLAKANKRINVS